MSLPDADRVRVALLVGVLVVAGGVPAVVGATTAQGLALQSGGPNAVTDCTTITQSGRYVLDADVRNATVAGRACIEIRADDVTLDGGGHALVGDGRGTAVAVVGPASNVTVANVTATGWNLGVTVENASNVTVRDVAVSNTVGGVRLTHSPNGSVTGTTVSNSYLGLLLEESDGATLANDTATNDTVAGVALQGTNGSTLVGNTVSESEGHGIGLVDASHNTLRGNTVVDTTGNDSALGASAGLFLANASGNRVEDTTVAGNRNWTLYSTGNATNDVTNLTLANGTSLSITGTDVAVRPALSPPETPPNRRAVGPTLYAIPTSDYGAFSLAATYPGSEAVGVREGALRLWRHWNGHWAQIPGSNVDGRTNTVSGNLSAGGFVAPLGPETSGANATRSPFALAPPRVRLDLSCTALSVDVTPAYWDYYLYVSYTVPGGGDGSDVAYLGPFQGAYVDPFGAAGVEFTRVEVEVGGEVVASERAPDRCGFESGNRSVATKSSPTAT